MHNDLERMLVCNIDVIVRVCVCACMRTSLRVCMCVCVFVYMCNCMHACTLCQSTANIYTAAL